MVFIVTYIHTDIPEYSEVLGVFTNKDSAVDELLTRANYREKDGKLIQYMQECTEYESYAVLRNKVYEELELKDVDIYRITELPLL